MKRFFNKLSIAVAAFLAFNYYIVWAAYEYYPNDVWKMPIPFALYMLFSIGMNHFFPIEPKKLDRSFLFISRILYFITVFVWGIILYLRRAELLSLLIWLVFAVLITAVIGFRKSSFMSRRAAAQK